MAKAQTGPEAVGAKVGDGKGTYAEIVIPAHLASSESFKTGPEAVGAQAGSGVRHPQTHGGHRV